MGMNIHTILIKKQPQKAMVLIYPQTSNLMGDLSVVCMTSYGSPHELPSNEIKLDFSTGINLGSCTITVVY